MRMYNFVIIMIMAAGLSACGSPLPAQVPVDTGTTTTDDGLSATRPGNGDTAEPVEEPCDELPWYADIDGDGYGDAGSMVEACEEPDGHVSDATDCDDVVATTHPGAPELCDGVDNDCDGDVPDVETDDDTDGVRICDGDCDDNDSNVGVGDTTTYYADGDSDGFGAGSPVELCTEQDGYVDNDTDCNDSEATVYPEADELCNNVDDDCDGVIPSNELDLDGDGYSECEGDCDDDDATAHPNAIELCNDVDNDCSVVTLSYWDDDGDGEDCRTDCADADADRSHNFDEVCDNGIDDDCDAGTIDLFDDDNDGVTCDTDCDDNDDTSTTTQTWYADGDSDDYGDASDSVEQCDQPVGYVSDDTDCEDNDVNVNPGADEVCDSIDNDCDLLVDNDDVAGTCPDVIIDNDGDGYDEVADCDDDNFDVNPGVDEVTCDGIDNDCDALTEDDWAVLEIVWEPDVTDVNSECVDITSSIFDSYFWIDEYSATDWTPLDDAYEASTVTSMGPLEVTYCGDDHLRLNVSFQGVSSEIPIVGDYSFAGTFANNGIDWTCAGSLYGNGQLLDLSDGDFDLYGVDVNGDGDYEGIDNDQIGIDFSVSHVLSVVPEL